MTTIHFVYPHGERISTPDAIGRETAVRLRERYEVVQYDWNETRVIRPGPDAVLLGHPHPAWRTVFRRSARRPGWKRVIVLAPFCPGDLRQAAFEDPIVHAADAFLAITGRYWIEQMPRTRLAHWGTKLEHIDLAVRRDHFPPLDRAFNAPGERRFVYIGHPFWMKNKGYLEAMARAMPETEIAWIGDGKPIQGLRAYGRLDFSTAAARDALARHDFLLTVGSADANPTTILEAMAWGLVPVCTRESGYSGYPGIVNVPLDDVPGAVAVMRELQTVPEGELLRMQTENWSLLDRHFTWDRFAGQVLDAIEAEPRDDGDWVGPLARARLAAEALRSPFSPLRPWNLRITLRGLGPDMTRAPSPTGKRR